jgi:hypothetical protein
MSAESDVAALTDEAFNALRALKRAMSGVGLTQVEVDAFNSIIHGWAPPAPEMPDDYWPLLAQIESGGRPYIKARTSSGSGLYQFVRSTWQGEGGTWGPICRSRSAG